MEINKLSRTETVFPCKIKTEKKLKLINIRGISRKSRWKQCDMQVIENITSSYLVSIELIATHCQATW